MVRPQPFGLFLDERFWRAHTSLVEETVDDEGITTCVIRWPRDLLGKEWDGYSLTFFGVRQASYPEIMMYEIQIRQDGSPVWLKVQWDPNKNTWFYATHLEQPEPTLAEWRAHHKTADRLFRLFRRWTPNRPGRPGYDNEDKKLAHDAQRIKRNNRNQPYTRIAKMLNTDYDGLLKRIERFPLDDEER